MTGHALIESECLSLLARLFSALGDDAAFAESRAACEAWQFQNRKSHERLATFVCQQLRRATEARQVSREISGGRPDVCAVVMLGDGGRVMAASKNAWPLLHAESRRGALPLPSALVGHLAPTLSSGAPFPRALRVALNDGSGDIAGVLLGVDEIPDAITEVPRHVATLLLWDPALDAFTSTGAVPRSAYLRLVASD
jgi:hypothetical protein